MTEQEIQQILAALRDDPLPFGSVRDRVLAQARADRRRTPAFVWIAAAAALVFVTLWTRPAWKVEPMPPFRLAQIAPPLLVQHQITAPPEFRAARVSTRHTSPLEAAPPLTVKLLTPDPNVVIYWIVEGE
jgi:hypothetical protein